MSTTDSEGRSTREQLEKRKRDEETLACLAGPSVPAWLEYLREWWLQIREFASEGPNGVRITWADKVAWEQSTHLRLTHDEFTVIGRMDRAARDPDAFKAEFPLPWALIDGSNR